MNDFVSAEQPKPRTWPTVIGVLGLLWSGISLASGVWSLVVELTGAVPSSMAPGPIERVVGVLGLLVAGLLLLGSVQLLRRKAMGIQLLRAWVPLSLVMGLAGVGMLVKNRDAFEKAVRESLEKAAEESEKQTGHRGTEMPEGMPAAMWAGSVACGGIMAILPPLVPVIFVFGRRGREAMAEWSTAGSPWQLPQA